MEGREDREGDATYATTATTGRSAAAPLPRTTSEATAERC
jgi:hypothetical protein